MTEPTNNPDETPDRDDPAVAGMLHELHRGGEGDNETLVRRIMTAVGSPSKGMPVLEPAWNWLYSRGFWQVAAILVVLLGIYGGVTAWSVYQNPESLRIEATIHAPPRVTPGEPLIAQILLLDGEARQPADGGEVTWVLVDGAGKRFPLKARLDTAMGWDGMMTQSCDIPPELPEGDYTLTASVDAGSYGKTTVSQPLTVQRSFKMMVSTDKPLYQPGQTIHMRALALHDRTRTPVAGREALFTVTDAKGNLVCKLRRTTSDYGIASADFVLANQVNMGQYIIAVELGDTTSQQTVTVDRYVLPKFAVSLQTDKSWYAPGEVATGTLTATYTYGEPVANATVRITASGQMNTADVFGAVNGTTDDEGVFAFELPLPPGFAGDPVNGGLARAVLQAEIVGPGGSRQQAALTLAVSPTPYRVTLVPESGDLVSGVENAVYAFAATPDGRPAQVTLGAWGQTHETDAAGMARFTWTPGQAWPLTTLQVSDAAGGRTASVQTVGGQGGTLLLRTDRAVYRVGDSAQVELRSASPQARTFVDAVANGQTLYTQAVSLDEGQRFLTIDIPATWAGTVVLHAYTINIDGSISGDSRIIQVSAASSLAITATMDKTSYRPGESAAVDLRVTDSAGKPVQAALSLAAVDEAVYALSELRPGLADAYFALREELLTPRYEIHDDHAPAMPLAGNVQRATEEVSNTHLQTTRLAQQAVLACMMDPAVFPVATSAPFYQRTEVQRRKQAKFEESVAIVAAASPAILAIILALPLILVTIQTFIRWRPVAMTEGLDQKELEAMTKLIFRWWVGASFLSGLTIFIAIMGIENAPYGLNEAQAMLWLPMPACVHVVLSALLFRRLRQFRRNSLSVSLPRLRKLVAPLSVVHLLLWVIPGGLAVVQAPDELIAAAILVAIIVALAVGVSLDVQTRRIAGERSRWSPTILMTLGIGTLLGGGLVVNSRIYRHSRMASGGVFDIREVSFSDTASGAVLTGTPAGAEEPEKSSALGDGLLAPTRVRRYFPETLLWQPQLITDAAGRAQMQIPLADSITTWRLAVSAVSADGRLGGVDTGIRVFQPFFIDINAPVSLTQNDRVSLPIGLYNYLDSEQSLRLEVEAAEWFTVAAGTELSFTLQPREVRSAYLPIRVTRPGNHTLTVRAYGSQMADAVARPIRVLPDGERVDVVINGQLTDNTTQTFTIPPEAIAGANDLVVKVYPGAFSQVVEGLDGILRMPSGCFEQTSSSTYPNVLVLNYMRQQRQVNPELEMKAVGYISAGYQRLLSYECKGGGFEWFGQNPAHLVLTAYGLMEFSDMAAVHEVDPAVIERTREWLYGQQKHDGSWDVATGGIAEGAINAYQGQQVRTTAYVAWALAESGAADGRLDRALTWLMAKPTKELDTYTLALLANALVASDRAADARPYLQQLSLAATRADGKAHWISDGPSGTYSSGGTMAMETTALAVYAFIMSKQEPMLAKEALMYLVENKDSFGTWQSTQATILSMRALLAATDGLGGVESDLHLTVTANGKLAAETTITPDTADVYRLFDLQALVRDGENTVALESAGEGNMAYQIVATHYVPRLDSEETVERLSIDVSYNATTLAVGGTVRCRATLQMHDGTTAPMVLVDLGVPPGLRVNTADFDAMVASGLIERYELAGQQVIVYLRSLRSDQPTVLAYSLTAEYPVQAKSPASSAYQYYQPDVRGESAPVDLTID